MCLFCLPQLLLHNQGWQPVCDLTSLTSTCITHLRLRQVLYILWCRVVKQEQPDAALADAGWKKKKKKKKKKHKQLGEPAQAEAAVPVTGLRVKLSRRQDTDQKVR